MRQGRIDTEDPLRLSSLVNSLNPQSLARTVERQIALGGNYETLWICTDDILTASTVQPHEAVDLRCSSK